MFNLKKHRETLLIALLGMLIMAALNVLMLQWNPERWTNIRLGAWTAFSKGFVISGFDPHTYVVISVWRPLYELFRHPLLAGMMWPLSQLNEWIRHEYGINGAIYIVAVVWTVFATMSWVLMYKILRKIMELGIWTSLLLTFFFFSFSHVMLVTFVPDHMLLTMTVLLAMIYLSCRAVREGHCMAWWKTMLLYIVGTGITTTTSVKIWLADMAAFYDHKTSLLRNARRLFMRSLMFLLPTLVIGALYLWQLNTTVREEAQFAQRMAQRRLARDTKFAEQIAKGREGKEARQRSQINESRYFQWTDNTVARLPLLYENVFGEGLILHKEQLLMDANRSVNKRDIFVRYTHWGYYAVEAVIVLLFLAGLWCGRHERLMLVTSGMFLFDMFLHVGLRFASSDVYIMTAHWAFVIPIAIACLFKSLPLKGGVGGGLLLSVLTLFLWWHNLSLIAKYILA